MKKKLTVCLSVALIAVMAICGTLAYLTSEDGDVNTMTLGNVKIVQHEYQRAENEDGTFETAEIDGENSYVLEDFDPGKPLLPIVGDPSTGAAGWDETTVRMSQVESYGGMQVFAGKNAQDKFVTVENTGKTDAYVRTLVAIEAGSANPDLIGTSYHQTWTKNEIGKVEIGGNTYFVIEYVYDGAKLDDGSYRHENGVLPADETTYPNLSQVYLKSLATNEDCEAIDGNGNGTLDILVLSQAVQAEGFTDAVTAFNAGFGSATPENVAKWFENMKVHTSVETVEELENALKTAEEAEVTIDLGGEVYTSTEGFENNGNVKFENGTLNGSGTGYTSVTNADGKTVYNNMTILSAGGGINAWGPVEFNGGSVTTDSKSTSPRHVFYVAGDETQGAKGELVINGGEFTFSPSNLTRKGSYICAQGADATVVVNGGTFHKPSTRTAPIQALDGATVTIYGGSFAFDPSAFVAEGYVAVKGTDGYWTVSAE